MDDWGVEDFPPRDQSANSALYLAGDQSPEAAAKSMDYAETLGLPAAVIHKDPAFYGQTAKQLKDSWTVDSSPGLQQYLTSHPMAAPVSQDDLENMSDFLQKSAATVNNITPQAAAPLTQQGGPLQQSIAGGLVSGAGYLGRGLLAANSALPSFMRGYDEHNYGADAALHFAGVDNTAILERYEKEFQSPEVPGTVPFMDKAAKFFGGIAGGGLVIGAGAAGGAVLGGTLTGGVGAVPGAVIGATRGFATDAAMTTTGTIYRQLELARTPDGKPIPESMRRTAALAGGAIAGGLGLVGGGEASNALVAGAIKNALEKTAARNALAGSVLAVGKAGIEGAAINSAMSVAGSVPVEAAKQINGGFQTIFNDPTQRKAWYAQTGEAFTDGLTLFTGMAALGHGTSYVKDQLLAQQAHINSENFNSAFQSLAETKTAARSTELATHAARQDWGDATISIPAEKMQEVGLQHFPFVEDVQGKVDEALARGGDVQVPVAEYMGNLAKTPEVHEALKDSIKFGDGMSVEDAKEAQAREPESYAPDDKMAQLLRDFHAVEEPTVRFYHGASGNIDSVDYAPFLSPSREYAEAYANKSGHGAGNTFYVDIPKDHPLFAKGKGYDEVNNIYQNFQAPEEIGRQLKKVEDAKPVAQRQADITDSVQQGMGLRPSFAPGPDSIMRLFGRPEELRNPVTGESVTSRASLNLADLLRAQSDSGDPEDNTARQFMSSMIAKEAEGVKVHNLTDKQMATFQRGRFAHYEGRGFDTAEETVGGFYDPSNTTVYMNADKVQDPVRYHEVLNHEGLHHVFLKKLHDDKAAAGIINQIRQHVLDYEPGNKDLYGLTNEHEFVSEAFSNPSFQDYLRSIPAPELNEALRPYADKIKSAWDYFKFLVKKIVTGYSDAHDSAFDAAIRAIKIIDNDRKKTSAGGPLAPAASIGGDMQKLSPRGMQMSAREFEQYFKHITKLQSNIQKGVFDATEKLERQRQTQEWKSNLKETREAVSKEFRSLRDDGRPQQFAADYYLRTGKGPLGETFAAKLSRADVERDYPDLAGDLPGAAFGKDSMPADDLSQLFGYSSGREMLSDIAALERERRGTGESSSKQFQRYVNAEADARMEAKYGKLEQNIRDAAVGHALDVAQLDVLTDEMKKLAPEGTQVTREALAQHAKDAHAGMDAKAGRDWQSFMNLAGKGGRAAEKAMLAGKFDEAFKAKQDQALNFALAREARAFDNEMSAMQRTADKYIKNRTLDSVAQEYTDQVHALLQRFGMQVRRNPEELAGALGGKDPVLALHDFIEEKLAGEGREIPVDPKFFDASYSPKTVEDMRQFKDSLTALDTNGRNEQRIETQEGKEEFAKLKEEFKQGIAPLGKRFLDRDPKAGPIKHLSLAIDRSLLQMERMLDWVDKNDPNGVLNRTVWRPLQEAQNRRYEMFNDISKRVAKWEKVPGVNDMIETPEGLKDWQNGQPLQLSRRDLLGIMLHTGTESSLKKLTAEFLHDGQMKQSFSANDIAELTRQMRPEDWKFVTNVWDEYRRLWPEIEALSRRMSGVAPDKVAERVIATPHGDVQGGYFPLKADHRWIGAKDASRGPFDARQYVSATPPKGYTKTRTGATYPLSYDLSSTFRGLREVVHDLTMREALVGANKFMTDRTVQNGFLDTMGKEFVSQIRPWLDYAANPTFTQDLPMAGWEGLMRNARARVVSVAMLYKLSTAVKHGSAALVNSFGELGKAQMFNSIAYVYGNPARMAQRINDLMDMSAELRNRHFTADRDIGEYQELALGKQSLFSGYMKNGGWLISTIDLASAIPVFHAKFSQLVREGVSEDDAIFQAEKYVRRAHGSGGIINLPAVMRSSEAFKTATVGYTAFNHSYNQLRDIGREMTTETARAGREQGAGAAIGKFGAAAWKSMFYLALVGAVEQKATSTSDPDEGWGKWLAVGTAEQALGTIPVVRNIAQYFFHQREATTPLDSVTKALISDYKDAEKIWHGEPTKHALKDTISTVGLLGGRSGLPGFGQAAASAQFIWDLKHGDQRADDIGQFARGVIYGQSNPKPEK